MQDTVMLQVDKSCVPSGRTQFPRGQQCCVKASAPFKKQNKQLNAYYLIYTHRLSSKEMNLRNPRAIDRGTQFNAAHAQLREKLRPIALAETCRFLTIPSLEF